MNFDEAVRVVAEGHLVKRPDWAIAMKIHKSPDSGEQYFVCDRKGHPFPLSIQDLEADDFEVVKAVEEDDEEKEIAREIEESADKIVKMLMDHINSHAKNKKPKPSAAIISCSKCGKEKK